MLRKLIAVAFAGCAWLSFKPLAAQSFTLKQVMSGTFNSELKAAPVGSRVVWMANQEGRRNVWVAEATGDALAARVS